MGVREMNLIELAHKVKKKGILKSLSIPFNAYIFSNWEMLLLERQLKKEEVQEKNNLAKCVVTNENLHIFEKNFKKYIPSIKHLLAEGSHPQVYIDENDDACAMLWIHDNGDYYDKLLYKCHIHIPKGSIYQFAGEVAKSKRGNRVVLYSQQNIWNEYYEKGFKSTRALVHNVNNSALKMHIKVGFKETGQLIRIYKIFHFFTFVKYENYNETRLKLNRNK